ncbi:hypothetical protein ABZ800_28285 [Streptomyces sp. NPDC047813]|uniref:hypothetical protein n=1 Tax=Streptomyces sp. NPDC047813 TaxID=3154608 RepID=UPI0033FF0983
MRRRTTPRAILLATDELLLWWGALALLWLVLISAVDTLERIVGASVAAAGALPARAGTAALGRRDHRAHRPPRRRPEPHLRLQSGHVGDYVAWLLVGTTLLAALALPGVLGG